MTRLIHPHIQWMLKNSQPDQKKEWTRAVKCFFTYSSKSSTNLKYYFPSFFNLSKKIKLIKIKTKKLFPSWLGQELFNFGKSVFFYHYFDKIENKNMFGSIYIFIIAVTIPFSLTFSIFPWQQHLFSFIL